MKREIFLKRIRSLIKSENGAVEFVEGSYLYPMAFILIFVIVFLSFFLMNKALSDSTIYYKFQVAVDSENFGHPQSLISDGGVSLKEYGLMIKQIKVENKKLFQSLYPFRFFNRHDPFESGHSRDINWTSPANDIWHMQAINYLQKANLSGQ